MLMGGVKQLFVSRPPPSKESSVSYHEFKLSGEVIGAVFVITVILIALFI